MKKLLCFILIVLATSGIGAFSQDKAKTLFPYPNVPDTIKNLENRSNYFVSKFWDKFNFSKPVSDTAAFNEAFNDWITFFRYAHKNVVKASVSDVMNKAQSNMKNFWMFADAAEKDLYSTEATLPSDEAYVLFVNNIIRSSKVKKDEKLRYQKQIVKINSNQNGNYAPKFDFTNLEGQKQSLDSIKAETIILFFNDPDCEDCNIARLRLATNVNMNKMIDDKKVAIVSILPGKYTKEWAKDASKYSDKWIIGAWENADEVYDLRVMPSIYILDAEKKIVTKHMQVNDIINLLNP